MALVMQLHDLMIVKQKSDLDRAAVGGVVSGVAAGAFLTIMMTAMSWANDKDIWYGMKGASAPLFGERAMTPGFDLFPVVFGLGAHFVVSIAWAVSFATLFYGLSKAATLAAGVLWGFVTWMVMYGIVLPLVGLSSMTHDAPVGRAIMFHMIYAIPMAVLFLEYQREQRITRHVFA